MAYYLGIDGGGSKTTCAVGDELSLLARSEAGGSNITRVGQVRARESLHQAIREACAAASIEPRQIDRACIGVAGAGRTEAADALRKIIAEVIGSEIEVVGDMAIALEAAFGAGPGVIVIAGTGSIACGRDSEGKMARAGGWGFAVSDEGSAHWIGRTAIAGVLRAIDESTKQDKDAKSAADALPLFREAKAVWNLSSLDDFVRTSNSNPDFAALLPALVAAADAGDALTQGVLSSAGRELAELARIVIRRLLTEQGTGLQAIPLAIAGGVFRHSQRVRDVFCEEIRLDPRLQVDPQVVEPVTGALQMARRPRLIA